MDKEKPQIGPDQLGVRDWPDVQVSKPVNEEENNDKLLIPEVEYLNQQDGGGCFGGKTPQDLPIGTPLNLAKGTCVTMLGQ